MDEEEDGEQNALLLLRVVAEDVNEGRHREDKTVIRCPTRQSILTS